MCSMECQIRRETRASKRAKKCSLVAADDSGVGLGTGTCCGGREGLSTRSNVADGGLLVGLLDVVGIDAGGGAFGAIVSSNRRGGTVAGGIVMGSSVGAVPQFRPSVRVSAVVQMRANHTVCCSERLERWTALMDTRAMLCAQQSRLALAPERHDAHANSRKPFSTRSGAGCGTQSLPRRLVRNATNSFKSKTPSDSGTSAAISSSRQPGSGEFGVDGDGVGTTGVISGGGSKMLSPQSSMAADKAVSHIVANQAASGSSI